MVTRVTEGGRRVSISDTYQPLDAPGLSAATDLEETISDQLPSASRAEWLRTAPGDLVKSVQQHYFTSDGRVMLVSNISYPMDRYDAFVFRMKLTPES